MCSVSGPPQTREALLWLPGAAPPSRKVKEFKTGMIER